MNSRDFSPLDRLLIGVDQAVRTVFGRPQVTERNNPAHGLQDPPLEDASRVLKGPQPPTIRSRR